MVTMLPAVLAQRISKTLEDIKESGSYKSELAITVPSNTLVDVLNSNGKTFHVVNFCSNSYLGLSDHPKVIQRAQEYLSAWGNGLCSSRFICGTQVIHKNLEKQINEFYGGNRDTILYSSCFNANNGVFQALLTKNDAIISDSLNHASIIDGIRLCGAKRFIFTSGDTEDLENKLKMADEAGCKVKLIATDGVFSMDGDIAPLDKICDVAEKYNAIIFVDDVHATGFLGPNGKGTPEHCGVLDRIHIINSTFGKALGCATGGYTTASPEIIDLLRNVSRPYLFSNSLSPSIVGAASAALDIVACKKTREAITNKLWRNTEIFRSRMSEAGFMLLGSGHPIIPIMLGDTQLASRMVERLLDKGIHVIGISYPVVPKNEARIRVQLSAAHSEEQVHKAVDAFIEVGRELNVI